MINDFINTIKGQLRNQLGENTDLGPDKVDRSAEVTADSFKEGITEKARQGEVDEIAGLTRPGGESSGFANNLIDKTVNNLAAKAGLPKDIATRVAGFAIPFIVSKFRDFTSQKGKNNKEGVQDLLGDLITGSAKDKLGGLGKKFGL